MSRKNIKVRQLLLVTGNSTDFRYQNYFEGVSHLTDADNCEAG